MSVLNSLAALRRHSLLGSLVRLPLRFIPATHVTKVRAGINRGFRWIVGSSPHGCWLGTYESKFQETTSKVVRPGMVVWDVGANAGFFTLAFSRAATMSGMIYAFEPFAENIDNLLKHIRLNGIQNATVVQCAMASSSGFSAFSTGITNTMGGISAQGGSYLVSTVTADDFVARYPKSRPDFVKIDVEGAEGDVLAGATHLLGEHGPDVYVAIHSDEAADKCAEILIGCGYTIGYPDGSPADKALLRSGEIYARKK